MKKILRQNTTGSIANSFSLSFYFNRVKNEKSTYRILHPGKMIASHKFKEPYPLINETTLLSMTVMDLLTQYAYPTISGYSKFTIQLHIKRTYSGRSGLDPEYEKDHFQFMLGEAIPLSKEEEDQKGLDFFPKNEIRSRVNSQILEHREKYDGGDFVTEIAILIYMECSGFVGIKTPLSLSEDAREKSLIEASQPVSGELLPIKARKIVNRNPKTMKVINKDYPSYIRAIKSKKRRKWKAFLVADTETILINDTHTPYAAGVMIVIPGVDLRNQKIYTYYSEDYNEKEFKSFEERSQKLLNDYILRIISITKQNPSIKTVYFHNFAKFDGLFILKHLAVFHRDLKLKVLMRNNILYQVQVISGKRMLFSFRDSLHLLSGKLDELAKNLCPEFGSKGSIQYDKVSESSLTGMKIELLDYMKQDILLLGGVMQKFQDLYGKAYNADIESCITTASLALTLFRSNYYDDVKFPIHIPSQNEDTFIRRGYYGGHSDTYIPYGENLYYYDVNSLYPFVMKEFPMPGGKPVWCNDLGSMELDSMFGFIEACVECPKTMKRPFLPYRTKNGSLVFPTGEFVEVYYSEELKYARDLGYKVLPIRGYLFEKMESPFKDYITSLFESRSNAKKEGNHALSYVYKLLLNSLYGRFGIKPVSTITEMCSESQRDSLLKDNNFRFLNDAYLREDLYIVSFNKNRRGGVGEDHWNPPSHSAVQLSAAITANARIYMYKYTSRIDCYYTDTDSIVIGSPLPNSDISSSVLGMFKLEDHIVKGFFPAPKSYAYSTLEGKWTMKYKGPAKNIITKEWFEQQHIDPYRVQKELIPTDFKRDFMKLKVGRAIVPHTMRIAINDHNKRIVILNQDGKWVDTEPLQISDLSALDNTAVKIIRKCKQKIVQLEAKLERYERLDKNTDKNTDQGMKPICQMIPDVSNTQEVEDVRLKGEEKDETPDIVEKSDQPENPENPPPRWSYFDEIKREKKEKEENEDKTPLNSNNEDKTYKKFIQDKEKERIQDKEKGEEKEKEKDSNPPPQWTMFPNITSTPTQRNQKEKGEEKEKEKPPPSNPPPSNPPPRWSYFDEIKRKKKS